MGHATQLHCGLRYIRLGLRGEKFSPVSLPTEPLDFDILVPWVGHRLVQTGEANLRVVNRLIGNNEPPLCTFSLASGSIIKTQPRTGFESADKSR